MSLEDHQNLSKLIEESSEKLDLLEKTLLVDERQRQRLLTMTMEKEREREKARTLQLYDGTLYTPSTLFEQEECHRKELVEEMMKSSTPSNMPIVRCINNVQGIYIHFLTGAYFFLPMSFKTPLEPTAASTSAYRGTLAYPEIFFFFLKVGWES